RRGQCRERKSSTFLSEWDKFRNRRPKSTAQEGSGAQGRCAAIEKTQWVMTSNPANSLSYKGYQAIFPTLHVVPVWSKPRRCRRRNRRLNEPPSSRGVRVIAGHELNPRIRHGGDKSHVPYEPVQLGND